MTRYSTKPCEIISGTYKGKGFIQQQSKKNPAAPGKMMVQVCLMNGMVVWVSPERIIKR